MKKFWVALQFAPLSAFVIYARVNGISPEVWAGAFKLAALLAFVETLLLIYKKVPLNRLVLGTNLFLFLGGIGFQFHIVPILRWYGNMMEATLFAAIIAIGIVTTLCTSIGFIGVPNAPRHTVMQYSAILLVVAVGCFIFSLNASGNLLLAGVVPFLCLVLCRRLLCHRLNNAQKT